MYDKIHYKKKKKLQKKKIEIHVKNIREQENFEAKNEESRVDFFKFIYLF